MLKNLPANAGGVGSIPGLGRSPGEENGNPLQYSCLESFMDRGAWQATVHGVTKESNMTEQLSTMLHMSGIIEYLSFCYLFCLALCLQSSFVL